MLKRECVDVKRDTEMLLSREKKVKHRFTRTRGKRISFNSVQGVIKGSLYTFSVGWYTFFSNVSLSLKVWLTISDTRSEEECLLSLFPSSFAWTFFHSLLVLKVRFTSTTPSVQYSFIRFDAPLALLLVLYQFLFDLFCDRREQKRTTRKHHRSSLLIHLEDLSSREKNIRIFPSNLRNRATTSSKSNRIKPSSNDICIWRRRRGWTQQTLMIVSYCRESQTKILLQMLGCNYHPQSD
jgi:hypothetical protein